MTFPVRLMDAPVYAGASMLVLALTVPVMTFVATLIELQMMAPLDDTCVHVISSVTTPLNVARPVTSSEPILEVVHVKPVVVRSVEMTESEVILSKSALVEVNVPVTTSPRWELDETVSVEAVTEAVEARLPTLKAPLVLQSPLRATSKPILE
jgi:hypothetical protein